jgi:hypothetical protein
MAIDMIENNELAALAPSRLGLREFVDDEVQNYTGDDEFYNLFGSGKRKESLANVEREAREYWSKYPLSNCQDAEKLINLTQTEVESLNKRLAAKSNDPFIPVWIRVTREVEGNAKKMYVGLDCEAIIAAETRKATAKELIETTTQTGDASVKKALDELSGLQSTFGTSEGLDNKKILLYGGIGVGALIVIALILRR